MIADGQNTRLSGGLNSDILSREIECYHEFKDQPKDHVRELVGLSTEEKCQSVFNHLITHTYYKLDDDGYQYIKSPARLLSDGCGDCKSFAMYICCCLHCLCVPHMFRFVNFDGSDQYTHVYAVALDEQGNEIILDACETDNSGMQIYDYARPYVKKKDFVFDE